MFLIKSNYYRKPKYRIMTTIKSKHVIKKALSPKSLPHLKRIIKNEKLWQDYLGNLGMVVKAKYFKKTLIYNYYNRPNLKTELYNTFIKKDYKKFGFILDTCFKYLGKLPTTKLNNFSKEKLAQYQKIFKIKPNYNDKFIKIANIDLVPDNLIFNNKKVLHIDSEWVFNFPLEIGFLKTRIIFYLLQNLNSILQKYQGKFSTITSNKILCPTTWSKYIKKYTNEEIDKYIQQEINFQKYINRDYDFDINTLISYRSQKTSINEDEFEIIKSSKFFKLWPIYCQLKKIFKR